MKNLRRICGLSRKRSTGSHNFYNYRNNPLEKHNTGQGTCDGVQSQLRLNISREVTKLGRGYWSYLRGYLQVDPSDWGRGRKDLLDGDGSKMEIIELQRTVVGRHEKIKKVIKELWEEEKENP